MKKYYYFILLTLFSCTVYRVYKLDEMNNSVKAYILKLKESEKRFDGPQAYILELKKVPNNLLSNKIINQIENFNKEAIEIKKEMSNFENLYNQSKFSRMSEIKSTDPDFKQVEPFQAQIKKLSESLEKKYNKLSKEWNELTLELEKNKIFIVNSEEIKSSLTDSLTSFKQSISTVKSSISLFELELNKNDMKAEKKNKYISKIAYLKQTLIGILKLENEFNSYFLDVKDELGNKNQVLLLPNMKAYGHYSKIKDFVSTLNILVDEFNKSSNELKKIK